MRSLFFKIFIIFWIAQSLIFVISTALIIRHRVPHPEFVLNALFNDVQYESSQATSAFESGGCAALDAAVQTRENSFALEDQYGNALCPSAVRLAVSYGTGSVTEAGGKQVGDRYLWRAPVVSKTGKKYLFLLSAPQLPKPPSWYQDLFHFAFPQLPVAIAVGGLTTFVLVLLFTRPVIRLRKAARELAQGNLRARVQSDGTHTRVFQGDEFHALVDDFNHMADRLESLVDAQKLLLRDVSHELRSPLARFSVALELSREDADKRMSKHLDRFEREAERLNQLIGQLLTLSSMEALEAAAAFRPVSLNKLIEEMIPDAEFEARQRKCSVVFHSSDDCTIQGNHDLLYRAIENVVRNAIRYTDVDTEVEIRLRAVKNDTGLAAILDVSDHGPGIPDSEIQAIFRPFYRVDHARSSETGGFGVGLAIAERAVKLHNGELRAINGNGGVTFRMQFQSTDLARETSRASNG
jgi:two-component system, OmpR family, sensor histidine kinase CpxA